MLLVTGVIVMLKQDRYYRKMEDVRIALEQSRQKARRASWPEMSDPIDIPPIRGMFTHVSSKKATYGAPT